MFASFYIFLLTRRRSDCRLINNVKRDTNVYEILLYTIGYIPSIFSSFVEQLKTSALNEVV